NRLSILDLSSQSHQPMWDKERDWCMTYNGEIYNYLEIKQELLNLNYHFETQSDTEVILHAFKEWGTQALQKFNGPFAFVIFNNSTQKLWLCRDRFGVKPLYYFYDKENLLFASTPNTLAKYLNLAPNLEYVSRGLHYWVYENSDDVTPF